jgi:hypothetical protein
MMEMGDTMRVELGLYEYRGLVYRVYAKSSSLDGGEHVVVMRPNKAIDYDAPLRHTGVEFFLKNFHMISDHF